jgi:deazaflavin-dependent oxidoreductase (nitroreductase family)
MGLLTPLAIKIGSLSWTPKVLPQIVWTDRLIQRVTRGRFSLLDIAGLPNLTLTVTGRRSGIARSTPLLCVPYRGTYLIAGSYFGGPKQPIWVVNLEAAMSADVRISGRSSRVTARRVVGDERAEVWQHMLRTWPNFAKYEERTNREIKVFELTPQR